MIKPVLPDFMSEFMPNATQVAEARHSVMDNTFQQIFNTIQDNRDAMQEQAVPKVSDKEEKEEETATDDEADTADSDEEAAPVDDEGVTEDKSAQTETPVAKASDADKSETPEDNSDEVAVTENKAAEKTAAADENKNQDNLDKNELKEKITELLKKMTSADSNVSKDLLSKIEKVATIISDKLAKLADDDLAAFTKLMNNLSKVSLNDLAKTLGLAENDKTMLAKLTDMDMKIGEAIDKKSLKEMFAKAAQGKSDTDNGEKGKSVTGKGDEKPLKDDGLVNDVKDGKKAKGPRVSVNAPAAKTVPDAHAINKAPDHAEAATTAAEKTTKANTPQTTVKITGQANADVSAANGNNNKTTAPVFDKARVQSQPREAFERMLVDQVVRKARIHIRSNGSSNMTIQLDPPKLGKVNMRIQVQDQSIKAVMIAETPEVRKAIESNLDSLKNQLNNQGLKLDQIEVSTAGDFNRGKNEGLAKEFGREGDGWNSHTGFADDNGELEEQEAILDAQARALAHDGVLSVVA